MTAEAILDSDSVIDDQAKAILNPMNLTAAAEGGEETPTPETAAAETAAPETQAPETSPASPETTAAGNLSAGNGRRRRRQPPETQCTGDQRYRKQKLPADDSARTIIETGAAETVQAQAADSVSDTITLDPSSGDGLGGDDHDEHAVKTEDKSPENADLSEQAFTG